MGRLAYILNSLPGYSETFIRNEIQALLDEKFDISIVTHLPEAKVLDDEIRNEDVLSNYAIFAPKPYRIGACLSAQWLCLRLNPKSYLKLLIEASKKGGKKGLWAFLCGMNMARELLRNSLPKHLHSHFAGQKAWVISKYINIPYSLTIHANEIFCPDGLTRTMLNEAVAIATISNFNSDFMERAYKVPREKIYVIHCHVETHQELEKDIPFKRSRLSTTKIVSVGRLVEKKGFHILLQSLSYLKKEKQNFECYIVGGGPEKKSLNKLAGRLELDKQVRWCGPLTSEETLKLIKSADLFVLPCVAAKNADMDGIPVVLMEAMSLSVPVISTTLSGIPELIENWKEGILCPPGDAKALYEAIKTIIRDENTSVRLSKAGKIKTEKDFETKKIMREKIALFRGLLSRNRS